MVRPHAQVGFAVGDEAAGFSDAQHFAVRGDGVVEVCQDHAGVHDVEGGVGEGEGVDISRLEGDVVAANGLGVGGG